VNRSLIYVFFTDMSHCCRPDLFVHKEKENFILFPEKATFDLGVYCAAA